MLINSRRWSQLPMPEVWVAHTDFLPKSRVWKGGEGMSNFTWGNLTNTTLARWPRSTTAVLSPFHSVYPWYHVMRMVHHLRHLLPKIDKPSIIIKKKKKQTNPNFVSKFKSQIFLGHQKQGKSEILTCKKDPKETWLLNIMWYYIFQDGILEEKLDIRGKLRKSE